MGEAMQVGECVCRSSVKPWSVCTPQVTLGLARPDVRVCANILSFSRNRFYFYLGNSHSPFPIPHCAYLLAGTYVTLPNLPSITSRLSCFYQPLLQYTSGSYPLHT